jgi:thymidylate kinase
LFYASVQYCCPTLQLFSTGLDGVGKTSIGLALSKHLNAHYLRTPPESIRSFREHFDSSDDATRRAYYNVGNFLASKEIAQCMEEGDKSMQ